MNYRRKRHHNKGQRSRHQDTSFEVEYTNPGVSRPLSTGSLNSGQPYQRPVDEQDVDRLIRNWDSRLLISKRDFALVQKIAGLDTRTAPDGDSVYLFSGLLICNSCGGRMTRKTNTVNGKKYIYYHCPTGKKNGCRHPVMLKEGDLVQCVLEGLQAHISSVVSLEELLDSISEEQANRELIAGYKEQIADNQVKAEQARRFKAMLYENLINGLITKDEYRYNKDMYTTQIEQAEKAVDLLRTEMERASSNASDRLRWTQHFKEFSNMTELDRRAVVALIHSIKVIGKNKVKITFRYQMEYEQAVTAKEAV